VPAPSTWPPARLHIVTGKGGTGKTTVAAALALALASGDRRVLLVEVEGRHGIAPLFDAPPLPYTERRIATAPGGGELMALAVDPEQALLEYLEMFYNLKRAGRALGRMGAVDFATTVAPGLRDVLLTGKVKEAVTRVVDGRRAYDAVVLDAPPTGRISRFLNVTAEVAGLAKVGPIKTQSDGVMAVLRSSQTAVHLVTVLEEMPVQETQDAIAELTASSLPVGAIFINRVQEPLLPATAFGAGAINPRLLVGALDRVGLAGADLAPGLAAEATAYAQRHLLEERFRRELAAGPPTYELPLLPPPVDLGGLYELVDLLAQQGIPAPEASS
jgi:anion-transporting  ArsA/GET3 family ATPase